jgi:hypothetical protein
LGDGLSQGTEYYISFEGCLLLEKGGYVQDELDKEQQRLLNAAKLRKEFFCGLFQEDN